MTTVNGATTTIAPLPETQEEVMRQSVFRDDLDDARAARNFFFPVGYSNYDFDPLPPLPLGRANKQRDRVLRRTLQEPNWAAAVGKAVEKQAVAGWLVKSDKDSRAKKAQDLLHGINMGEGWLIGQTRLAYDYTLSNNGCFLEVIRERSGAMSRITGLAVLPSLQCYRTGVPETPVIYVDNAGRHHVLKDYQVLFTSASTGADGFGLGTIANGVGQCPADKVYKVIQAVEQMTDFFIGKLTGQKTTALDFVEGIDPVSLRTALSGARHVDATGKPKAENPFERPIQYKSAVLVPLQKAGSGGLQHTRVEFSSIPDGYNKKEELEQALKLYALVLGMAAQELVSNAVPGGLNSGMAAQVMAEQSQGNGLAVLDKWLEWIITERVFPADTIFTWSTNDTRSKLETAQLNAQLTQNAASQVQAGFITAPQGTQILVEQEVIPKSVLPEAHAATANLTLTDTEKPIETPEQGAAVLATSAAPNAAPAPAQPQTAQAAQTPPVDPATQERRRKLGGLLALADADDETETASTKAAKGRADGLFVKIPVPGRDGNARPDYDELATLVMGQMKQARNAVKAVNR